MPSKFNVGDVVMIKSYGNDKFLVCRGWYTYEGCRRSGMYYKRVPDGLIVPESEVKPEDAILVNEDDGCGCPPHRHPHDHKESGYFTTVDTIEDRNNLVFPQLQHGRIVRVNDVDGQVKYYEWDAEYFTWKDYEFPAPTSVTERIHSLDQRLIPVEQAHNWVYMSDLVSA